MNVKYVVELTETERESLEAFVGGGSKLARKVKRAQEKAIGAPAHSSGPTTPSRAVPRPR